jgi:uncharacterized protein YjbI with pentapeptide repeats
MFSTAVIAVAGILLLIGTIVPGVRLWWPQHADPVSRSDLGVALMTGALIAFAVLAVQVLIQIRSQRDANAREDQADRSALLLQLGRSQNLSDLDLQGQDLTKAYLKDKDLSGANLGQAVMARASLQDSKLVGANLTGATLDAAQLQRADLRYAALGGASLVGAKLNSGNLDAATLTGVDLSKADLSNASARADLRRAVLADANLEGTRMDRANFQGADFTGAEMQFADLRGANLKGANLLKAQELELAKDLSLATFDRRTRWPPTFIWPPQTGTRPRCSEPSCRLKDSPAEVNELPQGLVAIRETIERAAHKGDCLPGWVVEDQRDKIEAHAPRLGAIFSVSTRNLPNTSPKVWASESTLESPKPIPSVTADGAAKRIYAVRSEDLVSSQPYKAVHVWFFLRGGKGFHAWAEAPPVQFSLFERDFIKLFAVVGIEGDLFPWLRGGEHTCR